MNASANARRVAESSGVALFEDEAGRLHFADSGAGWAATPLFVIGLLAVIFTVNGIVQVAVALFGNGFLVLGASLLGVGALLGLLWRAVWRSAKRARSRPLAELSVLLALDIPGNVILDGRGRPIAPLASLRFRRAYQMTSSSRRLVAEWPGGECTLVRGNPFSGGLRQIVAELGRRGFRC